MLCSLSLGKSSVAVQAERVWRAAKFQQIWCVGSVPMHRISAHIGIGNRNYTTILHGSNALIQSENYEPLRWVVLLLLCWTVCVCVYVHVATVDVAWRVSISWGPKDSLRSTRHDTTRHTVIDRNSGDRPPLVIDGFGSARLGSEPMQYSARWLFTSK